MVQAHAKRPGRGKRSSASTVGAKQKRRSMEANKLSRKCNIFECPHWMDMKCARERELCIFASDEWMETPQREIKQALAGVSDGPGEVVFEFEEVNDG